jgi:hypothetical protein
MSSAAKIEQPRSAAYDIPLDEINVAQPELFRTNTMWPYFERLRREDPVHYCATSDFGPYWSVTKYKDIMQVDTSHQIYSSEASLGGISIRDQKQDFLMPMFIAMDPPKHDAQRKVVNPIVAPDNLAKLEGTIRERAGRIVDRTDDADAGDPVRLSVGRPAQADALVRRRDRRAGKRDCRIGRGTPGGTDGLRELFFEFVERAGQRAAGKRFDFHARAWRRDPEHGQDGVSGKPHSPDRRRQRHDAQFDQRGRARLEREPGRVCQAARQPVAHSRHGAGKTIRKGDRVVMWYVSGNRDPDAIENPDAFIIDRARPRQHLSFGFGIHRCVGNRLAEMQLRIVWEEILRRFSFVEVMGEPVRVYSSFVKGYSTLPVRLHALN